MEKKLPAEVVRRIKGRPYYAYLYARNVLKGRLPERLEIVFKDDPQSAWLYSQNVLKGRLPDHIHNALVMYAMEKKDADEWVAAYLESVK